MFGFRFFAIAFVAACPSLQVLAADQIAASTRSRQAVHEADTAPHVQVRLGGVMREIAYRFSNSYWAANGGNWGLAQYQLIALDETLNTAKKLAPDQTAMLHGFQTTYTAPLLDEIARKNLQLFNDKFAVAMSGCNECHIRHERGFLQYNVPEPASTGAFLDFTAKTEPRRDLIKRH
jgi:hypothetical protein